MLTMHENLIIGGLGVAMGIMNAISGGAGVFGVPAMLLFGISPLNTLALNKISDIGMIAGAIRNYHTSKNIDWKLAILVMAPLVIGSIIGANLIVHMAEESMKIVIVLGVVVGIFFLIKPINKAIEVKPSHKNIGLMMMLLVGAWSGGLGMAGATFSVLVLVYFFGMNYIQGRSTDIIAAIPHNTIAVTILLSGSSTSLEQAGIMFISSMAGGWIGSHLAVKHGEEFIRKAMVGIAILMIIKVIADI